ncbi:hypothetical protein VTL71DRAFT_3735 [Oculimacula yallundae]|uniref:NB-ARC domain-containing protein n=1 Tax=Oculimacula yallundae TaxID=86028 RepID=A0ABR4C682_9HELO
MATRTMNDHFSIDQFLSMDGLEAGNRKNKDLLNNGELVVKRWSDALEAIKTSLSAADCDKISAGRDWRKIQMELSDMAADPDSISSHARKKSLNQIMLFPRTLAALTKAFSLAVSPYPVQFDELWGLFGLNLQLSSKSAAKLGRMAGWVKKSRNTLDLLTRCLKSCEEETAEGQVALVDVLEPFLQILSESLRYLRQSPSESDATKAWKALEGRINEYLSEMEVSTTHLFNMMTISKPMVEARAKSTPIPHGPILLPREFCAFPVNTILRDRDGDFFGRNAELEKINSYLDPRNNTALRTYTIFGRRGVGKTAIALEYAHLNLGKFDAIFWVNCETLGALRSSFAAIATALNLPNADRAGCHEENQLAVHNWLKVTTQHWLLIFDNAESSDILKGFWPSGANGAILITSRQYYNFANDAQRHGETVKPFNDKQSWELFMRFLGPSWQEKDKNGHMKGTEEKAARAMLKKFGGLALAIQQAAQLVTHEVIGGATISSTLELLKESERSLPLRPSKPRSDIEHALDSLWDMSFSHLSRNARSLLSVLSLLSPDGVALDLFLPTNQKALDGKLHFCKQSRNSATNNSDAALSSVISEPLLLRDAIEELQNMKLIKYERRILRVHRVVQDAMNYYSSQEMQAYFDSAACVVLEAFPKQLNRDIMSKQWITCESYIAHGISLSSQFDSHHHLDNNLALKGTSVFVELMINCAEYLCEICDYQTCLKTVKIGRKSCEDTESLQYAALCNIAGRASYELNNLEECRINFETFLRVQEKLLPEEHLERSSSLHQMGVLESASEDFDKALGYFARAAAIRIKTGDKASNLLASTYLRMSRVYYNQKDYKTALSILEKSEVLYLRVADAEAPFLAHIHYAYGNIHYAEKDWSLARKSYNKCLGISNAKTSVHPITIAGYYRLACVEFEQGHEIQALEYLRKALSIARLRSPGRDDGTIARILWRIALVLKAAQGDFEEEDADSMRRAAEKALKDPKNHGQGGLVLALNDIGELDDIEWEGHYDALVPEVFR